MASKHPIAFEGEASLDELAGVGKNRRFDEVVDDEDNGEIQVICRRPNPAPRNEQDKYIDVALAKPSRAFYFGDRNLYDQEANRFDQEEKARILNTGQYPRNLV